MANWEWNEASHRYRNLSTGRYLSAAASIELRDDMVTRLRSEADTLARRLATQELTVQQWETEMQRAVREIQTVQYAFGRGGRNAMTDVDRQILADLIRDQYTYLRGFAQDVAAGTLSEAQIVARAKLYHGSSVRAYEHGKAASWGVQLPHYPADGSTPCKSACRCRWDIADRGDTIEATWKRSASESCSGCVAYASAYAPLVIAKSNDGRIARLWRMVA